jgi:membrane-associated phospholipid phosphatase
LKQQLHKLLSAKLFLCLYGLFLVLAFCCIFYFQKGDLILYFNANRHFATNYFFLMTTQLAEFPFIISIFVILLFVRFGNAFIFVVTWAISGVLAQSLKRFFDMPRPAAVYDEGILNKVGQSLLHHQHSFPSGHATTAFALFLCLALMKKNNFWQLLFFILALATALSRVYLLQHFFVDIVAGSLLGVCTAILVFVSINSSNIFGFEKWKDMHFNIKQFLPFNFK